MATHGLIHRGFPLINNEERGRENLKIAANEQYEDAHNIENV